jgi:hypothetical protein
LYLDYLDTQEDGAEQEPTAAEAEHYFVALYVAALVGIGYAPYGPLRVREMLRDLGVALQ